MISIAVYFPPIAYMLRKFNAENTNRNVNVGEAQSSHKGAEPTFGLDPRSNTNGSYLIASSEWEPGIDTNDSGIRVITSTQRRNNAPFLDSKIHQKILLNNILAKIQANIAGVDMAVMLDHQGFGGGLADTNLLMIPYGSVFTHFADACLQDVPVASQLNSVRSTGSPITTGTMGELKPVLESDGKTIMNKTEKKLLPVI